MSCCSVGPIQRMTDESSTRSRIPDASHGTSALTPRIDPTLHPSNCRRTNPSGPSTKVSAVSAAEFNIIERHFIGLYYGSGRQPAQCADGQSGEGHTAGLRGSRPTRCGTGWQQIGLCRTTDRDQSAAPDCTGPTLSVIFFAVSSGTTERNTTRELQVPLFPGTMAMKALESVALRATLSW